jgi:type VI secretion system protein ImpG
MADFQHLSQQDYFYLTRRDESQLKDVRGTEMYISFLDTQSKLSQPVDETLGGTAVCSNRGLPEQLRIGDPLKLEGAGPVRAITVISRPTWHQTPSLIGARPWALASTLALNHLSLAEGTQALAALKDILRLHAGARNTFGVKQIDGIRGMTCKRVQRRLGRDAWRGFVQTLLIHLEFDRDNFAEHSVVLFGAVLRRFFALYCSVNMAVEVRIATNDRKGDLKQWSPLVANQENLGGDTEWHSQAGAQPVL